MSKNSHQETPNVANLNKYRQRVGLPVYEGHTRNMTNIYDSENPRNYRLPEGVPKAHEIIGSDVREAVEEDRAQHSSKRLSKKTAAAVVMAGLAVVGANQIGSNNHGGRRHSTTEAVRTRVNPGQLGIFGEAVQRAYKEAGKSADWSTESDAVQETEEKYHGIVQPKQVIRVKVKEK